MTEATHPIEEMLLTPPGTLKRQPAEDEINAILTPLQELEAFNAQLMELHRHHVGKRTRGRLEGGAPGQQDMV